MFCTNCSKELSANAKFCPHCGKPVVATSLPDSNIAATPTSNDIGSFTPVDTAPTTVFNTVSEAPTSDIGSDPPAPTEAINTAAAETDGDDFDLLSYFPKTEAINNDATAAEKAEAAPSADNTSDDVRIFNTTEPVATPFASTEPAVTRPASDNSASTNTAVNKQTSTPEHKPLSTIVCLALSVLYMIPVIGLVASMAMAFGATENQNKKALARTWLIFKLVGLALIVSAIIFAIAYPAESIEELNELLGSNYADWKAFFNHFD